MESFFLSFYQAVLDRNLDKVLMFAEFDEDQALNYSEEYPVSSTREILKYDNPFDEIYALFHREEFRDFAIAYSDAINPLATEENIAIREKSSLEILRYPLQNYCPNNNFLSVDNIISLIYSKVIKKIEVANKLIEVMNLSPIIYDILHVTSVSTAIDSNRTFFIHLIEQVKEYNPTLKSDGYHDPINNTLVVVNKNLNLDIPGIMHELAHKVMSDIFHNDADPYSVDSKDSQNLYHQAIKSTLLNVQKFIKSEFNLEIKFENEDSTWEIGKTLSSLLLPYNLDSNNIKEVIAFFDHNNLKVDQQYSWLRGDSLLENFLSSCNFEAADILVESGANIRFIPKYMSHLKIFEWYIGHQKTVDLNYKDCSGNTILDYVEVESDLYKDIIFNANLRSDSFDSQSDVNYECNAINETTIKTLYAIERLLVFYNQDIYDDSNEDAEFIVRLPHIISEGLYQGEAVEILSPIDEYWRKVITPAEQEYISQHTAIGFYNNPKDYGSIFYGYNAICEDPISFVS